jgi:tetratricopeptide (TPR) repeat protein
VEGFRNNTRLAALLLCAAAPALTQTARETGERLYREKRFTAAAVEFERHLKRNPSDFQARLLLGLTLQQAGETRAAEGVFREAVRRRPRHAGAHFFLARARYLLGRLRDAEESARTALKLGEPPARVHNLIGLIHAEQNDVDRALAAFRAAREADPEFAEALLNAGTTLLKAGRADDAAKSLTAALRLEPRNIEILYHRGRAFLELNRRPEAGEDLAAAAERGHGQARRLLTQLRSGGVGAVARHAAPGSIAPVKFQDVAAEAGLHFVLENSATPEKRIIETMPGGVAVFDADGDGWTDIFFANGASVPELKKSEPRFHNRLFRNDGDWKFRDITEAAGLSGKGYSMGAAAADYDNDGRVDLFVAGVRQNLLYRNLGGGRFAEVTEEAGIASDHWSVAAAWFDYDRDGLLDLFVVNYLDWQPAKEPFCGDQASGFRVYCHPRHYEGTANTLYRNVGDGRFRDVSAQAGIAAHAGKGMSAAVANYNQDGFPDVFVTNDTLPNFLFRNRGDGKFEEAALEAGVAFSDDGKAVSGMGADFQDYDNDGLPDIIMTALTRETFLLFRNQGKGFFRDATAPSGLAVLSAPYSGWGVAFADFNNDGWKDVFSANSHVTDNIEAFSADRYRQVNSVFLNDGSGRFRASLESGLNKRAAHRGAAFADFDRDGHVDVVVSALDAPAELWRNVSKQLHGWLAVKLEGAASNRDGIGARVRVDGQHRYAGGAVGYASSSRGPLHFGLGARDRAAEVEVLWPGGAVQVLRDVPARQTITVREPAK